MTVTPQTPARMEGSYLTPSFEHARVTDAMRPGVITCAPDTSLEEVARMMAANHVHAIVVSGLADGRPWGVISATDVVVLAREAPDRLAGTCAGTELITIAPDESLEAAAGVMREHEISHLLVVDPSRELPVGMVSSLDIVGVVAWGRA